MPSHLEEKLWRRIKMVKQKTKTTKRKRESPV